MIQDAAHEVANAMGRPLNGFRPQQARTIVDGMPQRLTALADAMSALETRLAQIDYQTRAGSDVAPQVADVTAAAAATIIELTMVMESLGQHSDTWVSLMAKRASTGTSFDFHTLARTGLMTSMGNQGALLAGLEQGL